MAKVGRGNELPISTRVEIMRILAGSPETRANGFPRYTSLQNAAIQTGVHRQTVRYVLRQVICDHIQTIVEKMLDKEVP